MREAVSPRPAAFNRNVPTRKIHGAGNGETEVTAGQVRDVVTRLIEVGQHKEGDPDILAVLGAWSAAPRWPEWRRHDPRLRAIRPAESALRSCALTVNRNSLPSGANRGRGTPRPATWHAGGGHARDGRGRDRAEIAGVIVPVLGQVTTAVTRQDGSTTVSKARFGLPDAVAEAARRRVAGLLSRYPLSQLDLAPAPDA